MINERLQVVLIIIEVPIDMNTSPPALKVSS